MKGKSWREKAGGSKQGRGGVRMAVKQLDLKVGGFRQRLGRSSRCLFLPTLKNMLLHIYVVVAAAELDEPATGHDLNPNIGKCTPPLTSNTTKHTNTNTFKNTS